MVAKFLTVDIDTPMMFPPDLREAHRGIPPSFDLKSLRTAGRPGLKYDYS